ncbi:MAG: sodium:solute symporter family protein [Beijerinckiaceae bacterium]|nr:sodium:solute symporter family protein [Beijerinckiaceae bacterium]
MLDAAIVVAFIVYGLGTGLVARRAASRDLTQYFLAGRTLSGWKAGLSMAATQLSADTPLLVTGLVATAGVFALWRLWIYALAFLLLAFVFAPCWRRSAVLTDAEFTELRYSGRGVLLLRFFKAIYYGTVINCVVMAMVLVAAVRIAEVFLPWHDWLPVGFYGAIVAFVDTTGLRLGESVTGLDPAMATANNLVSILSMVAFAASYSMTGGLRSVVNTDVGQLAVALVGTAVYAWFVVSAAGGVQGLGDRVVALYGAEQAGDMLSFSPPGPMALAAPFLMIVSLQWLFQMNADGTGYLAQRSMACRSDREARYAGIVFTWTQILLRSLLWLAIAVGLLVLYPFTPDEREREGFAAAREILFVTGVDALLPPGLRGLMLVGLLAALASTIDSHLNWGASYWSNDVYRRIVCNEWLKRDASDRELVLAARLSNLLVLAIALVIMANLGSIQTAWFLSLLFGAGVGSVLILRWLWERMNLYSEFAAMGASIVMAPLLLYTFGTDADEEWIRIAIMAAVTTAAAVGITYVTPPTNSRKLAAFYKQVHPYGFWSRAAIANGERPRAPLEALWVRIRVLALMGASLFLLLAGLGRLIVAPSSASTALTMALVAAGVALTPLWWRASFHEDLDVDRAAPGGDVRG